MLLKTQEILLETQGNLFKTQDTGAFEHNQAPKNRTNKKPVLRGTWLNEMVVTNLLLPLLRN